MSKLVDTGWNNGLPASRVVISFQSLASAQAFSPYNTHASSAKQCDVFEVLFCFSQKLQDDLAFGSDTYKAMWYFPECVAKGSRY